MFYSATLMTGTFNFILKNLPLVYHLYSTDFITLAMMRVKQRMQY